MLIIQSSLNEVCNGLKVRNFESTIGTSREQAETLLRLTSNLLKNMIDESEKINE